MGYLGRNGDDLGLVQHNARKPKTLLVRKITVALKGSGYQ
jgi:hypothetical protein